MPGEGERDDDQRAGVVTEPPCSPGNRQRVDADDAARDQRDQPDRRAHAHRQSEHSKDTEETREIRERRTAATEQPAASNAVEGTDLPEVDADELAPVTLPEPALPTHSAITTEHQADHA